MATQTTTIWQAGSNTYTVPTQLVGGTIHVVCYGATGDGYTAGVTYSGPGAGPWGAHWPGVSTTGGQSSLITATVSVTPGQTLTAWVGDASGHGYHAGGNGSAGSGGGMAGFQGGGSSALLNGATVLLEAAGGGGAGGSAYGTTGPGTLGFGTGRGGYGGQKFSAGYTGGVTPHAACLGGGGGGGGGHQGGGAVGAAGLNTHTGHGGTVAGGGGDSGVSRTGYAGGGGGGAGGTSFAAPSGAGVLTATFSDAAGHTTLGSLTISANVVDAPLAPDLNLPYNGVYVDPTQPITFTWQYTPQTYSGTQQSYAVRIAIDGGAYQYWDVTNQLLSPTIVWNSGAASSITLPANLIAMNHQVNWSVQTTESHYGTQSPWATDFLFTAGRTFKWQLIDPVTNEYYAFEINPNTGGSLTRQKSVSQYATTADDAVMVLYEGSDSPQPVTVSGTLLSQQQYTNMIYWYSKRRQILLIDDLGRNIWVYFVQWTPQRKWTKQSPWRHDWSAQFYIIGPQAVQAQ